MKVAALVVGMVRTNCYIAFDDAGNSVIIDPGDNAKGIMNYMKEQNLTPAAILLTHGHFDHIMAVPELREAFPEIPVYAYEAERVLLEDARTNESTMIKKPLVLSDVTYLKDRAELDLLGAKWELISTPGHTIGSCCYYIAKEKILFSGDTLFDGDCGRTDLATGDMQAIIHSIREVLMKLPDDVNVLPGHETYTTIGIERVANCVMRMR